MKRDLVREVLADQADQVDLVAGDQGVVEAAGVPVALDLVVADAYLQILTDLDLTEEVEDHTQGDLILGEAAEEVGLMAPLGQVAVEDFPLMGLVQEEVGLARRADGLQALRHRDQAHHGRHPAVHLPRVPGSAGPCGRPGFTAHGGGSRRVRLHEPHPHCRVLPAWLGAVLIPA